ncbi:MAG: DUF2269 family protein [Microthrixaceae bacterium]|nr:DUF2269 family protein [Microthrixaceae bacterium]
MGIGSFAYNLVLLLHILCAIVGFGGVMLNGVYASRARRLPPEQALGASEANTFVSLRVAEVFIYLVPVWGFGLIGLSDGAIEFSELWVWLSIVIYAIAISASLFALQPRVRVMLDLEREMLAAGPPAAGPPPQAGQLEAMGKQVGAISGVLHLSVVVLLVLMIWKPT